MLRRIGRRELAIGGVGAAAIAVALIALDGRGDGGAEAQGPGTPTAPLERRDLTSRESVDGTLGYAGEAAVISRLSGTITWLPAEGDVIGRGDRLLEVDGEPAILMYGDIPAYRDLSTGVSDGPDVDQLESNLAALGFDPGTVDDEFTSSTASAVADWQDSLGLDETGTVELGRIVFMAGARRVTSLSVSLGSSSGSSGSNPSDSNTPASSEDTASPSMTLAHFVVSPSGQSKKKKKKPGGKGKNGKRPTRSKKPSAQDNSDSANPSASDAASGANDSASAGDTSSGADDSSSNPATEVMTTSSERRVVTVDLDPSDGELVKRGTPARVELPDGKDVKGRVSSVGTVAASDDSSAQDGSSSDPTIEVTIALPEGSHVTGLDQAPVTVDLTDEVRRNVFVVPVEALLGTAGGGYAIEVTGADGRRQVPVEPGLFADGYVEVDGDGLREGMDVEVPGE
jgi:multidrug efflux pump subunit AcrA (membrane-fusion protein)